MHAVRARNRLCDASPYDSERLALGLRYEVLARMLVYLQRRLRGCRGGKRQRPCCPACIRLKRRAVADHGADADYDRAAYLDVRSDVPDRPVFCLGYGILSRRQTP